MKIVHYEIAVIIEKKEKNNELGNPLGGEVKGGGRGGRDGRGSFGCVQIIVQFGSRVCTVLSFMGSTNVKRYHLCP